MGKVIITMDVDPEYAEDDHPMGVTEAGHDMLHDLLGTMGSDIEITKAEP